MATGLAQIPGVEVRNAVEFTQVLTAFGDDERTIEAGRRLLADGTAVFTPATWRRNSMVAKASCGSNVT